MARPVQRVARKDYPSSGIKKGDTYWYVKLKLQRGGIVKRSRAPFKRSQLTTSDYLGPLYDWEDDKSAIVSMDDAQEFAERIRELGEEQQAKLDNMPEGLKDGDTGQMIQARAEACETAACEIEEIVSKWESAKDAWESQIEEYKVELAAYNNSADDDDSIEEPIAPDHTITDDDEPVFDESEWLEAVQNVEVSE